MLNENDHLEGDDDEDSHNVGSFVPIAAQKMTEKEAVRKSVAEGQISAQQVVPWPQRGDTPINEFITDGYISCAFLTLLFTGAGDFLAPRELWLWLETISSTY